MLHYPAGLEPGALCLRRPAPSGAARERHTQKHSRDVGSVSSLYTVVPTGVWWVWREVNSACFVLYSCSEGALTVSAATLKHRVLTFGYAITEDPLPGR